MNGRRMAKPRTSQIKPTKNECGGKDVREDADDRIGRHR